MEKTVHRPSTPAIRDRSERAAGFTLVELSIVLVIIGLLVGAVVVGHEMLNAAYVRAQIKQIEQYKTAINTFRMKYSYLPGDIPTQVAGQFGFFNTGMTGTGGLGDGNGLVESVQQYTFGPTFAAPYGEPLVFWRHLSDASLIDGVFGASMAWGGTVPSNYAASQIMQWLPPAKIGKGSLIPYSLNGQNYFQIFQSIDHGAVLALQPNAYSYAAAITPVNASTIDTKMDDGMPLTGRVQSVSSNGLLYELGAAPVVSEHCISAASVYDTGSANGNSINCDLSFAF